MIKSYDDYILYLKKDQEASFIQYQRPKITDDIWKFQRLMRKAEYYKNCKSMGPVNKLILYYLLFKYHKISVKLGFTVPLNTCDFGLWIVHYGSLAIHPNARVGKNCRIYSNVVIGSKDGGCPRIGDNCYIGAGAKIIGDIVLGNNITI